MSGTDSILRAAGQTVALSVVATAHAAVPLPLTTNDVASFCAITNAGTLAVAVKLSVAGVAATFPVDGTPGDFVVWANQTLVVPMPSPVQGTACQITAIASGAGPTIIYATPVVMQT